MTDVWGEGGICSERKVSQRSLRGGGQMSSSLYGLSGAGCYRKHAQGLAILHSMIDGSKTIVECCYTDLNSLETGLTGSAGSAIPVPQQRGQIGSEGSKLIASLGGQG